MMKKLNSMLVIIAVAAGLVAMPTAGAAIELSMYYPVAVGGPLTKIVDGLVADFMKENPDVKVNAARALMPASRPWQR